MKNNVVFSHQTDEWKTPISLFNLLNERFNFTLDPCSTIENHLCPKYYTKENNGLDQSWFNEIVFVNPPYSQIALWAEKCSKEYLVNKTKIVLLIPARTDTKYFHSFILPYASIVFIKGRLKFSGKGPAPFPSILCIYE